MSKSQSGSDHTVRPASRGGPSKVFCVLGFVAAAALVFWWGHRAGLSPESTNRHTATAKIHRQVGFPPGITATDASAARLSELWNPVPEHVASQITSKAFLQRIAASSESDAQEGPLDIVAVHKNLQVNVSKATGPGTLEIAITYTDSDADRSVRLVNRLAESYAADVRTQWHSRTREVVAEAGNATEEARRTLLEAQQQLDAITVRLAEQPSTRPTSPPVEVERPKLVEKAPARVDSPEWLELQAQLAQVKSHCDALLIERTELHPAVQDARMRISELEQRLASVPRKIPGPAADPSLPSPQPSQKNPAEQTSNDHAPSELAVQRRAEMVEQSRELKRTTKEADEAYQAATREERQAWETGQLAPRVDLDLARRANAPAPREPGWTVLLATLIAGIAGAGGMGMVSLGWAMEPTLGTVAEVGRATSMPVIGVVSESGLPSDQPESADRRHWLGPILILGGLMLIGGCMTMAINMLGI